MRGTNQTPTITLAPEWKTYESNLQEQIIYHELGHCVLNREHVTTKWSPSEIETDVPASIMNATELDSNDLYTPYHDHFHARTFCKCAFLYRRNFIMKNDNDDKPTRGPWSVYNNRIESECGQPIARAFTEMSDFVHNIPVIYPPERLANLRLMAAAPEMKEVIERLLYRTRSKITCTDRKRRRPINLVQ